MFKPLVLACVLAGTAAAQSFTATGSLAQARAQAAIAVLADGRVLVAGGSSLNSAEIYDPASRQFHATGPLHSARDGAAAMRLANGKVWIVGGDEPTGNNATTELFDPAQGSFAAGPTLPRPLGGIVLVAIPGGSVLVFGQTTDCSAPDCSSPVYRFDPASGQLASDGQLQITRNNFTATLLPTGKVLVVSGWAGNSMATSPADSYELFDPASGSSVLANTPQFAAFGAAAALLPNGQVLICGGGNHETGFSRQCILYDPAADTFAPTGSMAAGRNALDMFVLHDGRVLVMGGTNAQAPDAEIYDPALGTFASAGNFVTPRSEFSAALLDDGQVLVAGGIAPASGGAPGAALSSAELFTASSPVAGFSLAVQPAQAIVASGTTANFSVSASGANGFNSSIDLSCSGQGSATCAFNPGSITAGQSSNLTLGNLDVSKAGVVSFMINGTSGTTLAASVPARADLEPPIAAIAPAALSFGDEAVGGKSAAQTVTLANSGESLLQISAISATGDFTQTNNCPASLANLGNPTCTITVVFTPVAAGNRSGRLTITDNAPFSPQTITLSGIGTDPPMAVVSLNPSSLTFGGAQALGSTSPMLMVTLANTGTADLVLGAITASGDFAQTNDCGGTVVAGKSCMVSVTFTPTTSGARTGQLSFTDSAAGSPQIVPLAGTGAGAPAASISLLPANGGSAITAVNAGQTATFPLSLSGVAGFVGTVSLACAGAPAGAACTVNPSTVAVGAALIPVAVTVTTTSAAGSALAPASFPPFGWWLLCLIPLLALTEFLRRLLVAHWRAALLFLAVSAALAACGGNSPPPPVIHPVVPTPAGTYTLTVTATSSGTSAGQTQVTLVVH